jgi:DNA-binding response OmpR family regulator
MNARPARILVVEDEPALMETIAYNLRREGYEVLSERDGISGLRAAQKQLPDLVILDLMLPGMDGLDVCRQLRRTSSVPILILTARNDEVDKVVGLEMGADDYVTKPFSMRELVARVKAMLRRKAATPAQAVAVPPPLQYGSFTLDESRHEIRKRGLPLTLTPLEYALLEFLIRNHGATFSREALLERVWGYDYAGDSRTVDVHVRSLREKIEDAPGAPRQLLTVRGVGYRLDLD